MEQMIDTPAGEVLITVNVSVSQKKVDETISNGIAKFRYLQRLPFILMNSLNDIDWPPLDLQAKVVNFKEKAT